MTVPTDLLAEVLDGTASPSAEASAIEHDLDRIRRGLELVVQTPEAARGGSLLRPLSAAAAIAMVTGIAVAVSISSTDRSPRVAQPAPSSPAAVAPTSAATTAEQSGPVLGMPAPALSVQDRVRQADRIVVGTVTKLTRGEGESMGKYVLATVSVNESLKPQGLAGEVVAFDYDYSGAIVSTETSSPPWEVGQELLLFLVSDAGTVSENLQPAHLQVAEGASGRYAAKDGTVDAPFTLDDVRALAAGTP
ncbi:MAG: hypothetical protein ABIM89_17975 [Mycobacteriales bacterium]